MCKIICSAKDCHREAIYKTKQLCQKHYFRLWRFGTTELSKPEYGRDGNKFSHSNGYVLVRDKNHPLSNSAGIVYEHRAVAYAKYGEDLPPCEFCGKPSDWHSRSTHIDHIDSNRKNNSRENLRVLCNRCNTRRGTHVLFITIDGVSKTAGEWARSVGIATEATIRSRKKNGWSDYGSVYFPPRRHIRKNTIAL